MDAQAAGGLTGSLRAAGEMLLEMMGTRLELAMVELREEAERRKRVAAFAVAGATLVAMALLFAGAGVVALYWDTHRLAAIGAVTGLYAAGGVALLLRMAHLMRAAPRPFDATRRALAADCDLLKGGA